MNTIAAILTVYKRNNLDHQIRAVLSQTILPKEIYVWQNESHVDAAIHNDVLDYAHSLNIKISHIHSKDKNFKFHGRFSLPLLLNTEYVAIFDDDTIPNPRWFENCIRVSQTYNAIAGANGRTIRKDVDELCTGDGSAVQNDTIVDFVGHCWFFKREWIHHMWSYSPNTFDNGEDIHFAASCMIKAGIKCFVPMQPHGDFSLWGDTHNYLGLDEHATWKKPDHGSVRQQVKDYWINMGWKTVNSVQ